MSRIVYKLNGYNLNELGIIVKSADGLIDLPELKKRAEFDWADMHGKIIDTRRPYFEPRTITLDCAWPIEPRGRNLLVFTTAVVGSGSGLTATKLTDSWFHIEGTVTGSSADAFRPRFGGFTEADTPAKNGKFTLSVETRGTMPIGEKIRIAVVTAVVGDTSTTTTYVNTTEPTTIDLTGKWLVRVNMYRTAAALDTQIDGDIRFKLESGDTYTGWSPAPEDIGIDVATEGGTFNIQTAEEMVREELLLLGELVRLEVHFDSKILVKPLIFNVIQDKGITFGRKFSGADVLLTFKITLIEPQPCKIVLESKKTRGSYTRAESSIGFTPNGAVFDVDWGDGSTVYDIGSGSTLPITHTYSGDGTFYVIISGDVAAITSLTLSNDLDTLWTLK